MFNSELHQRHTLERLQKLREQAELERHIPKFSLRCQLAGFLHRLAFRLEHTEPQLGRV